MPIFLGVPNLDFLVIFADWRLQTADRKKPWFHESGIDQQQTQIHLNGLS